VTGGSAVPPAAKERNQVDRAIDWARNQQQPGDPYMSWSQIGHILANEVEQHRVEHGRLAAKVREVAALADVLDGEATTYPNMAGAPALRSAAARIRAALAYDSTNPANRAEAS
jgi:hypothetical protein